MGFKPGHSPFIFILGLLSVLLLSGSASAAGTENSMVLEPITVLGSRIERNLW
jgi:hypothetical protein